MKQLLSKWEGEHWFMPYLYGLMCYSLGTGILTNAKILASVVSVYFTLSIRVTPIFLINAILINSLSLEINQKNPQVWRLLIKRSLLHAIGQACLIISAYYNSISITSTFYNLGPVMTFFLESYMYKKPVSRGHLALTMICFIGVMLIVQPSFLFGRMNQSLTVFWLLPLIAAFLNCLSFIYLHDLKGKVDSLVSLEYFITCQAVVAGVCQNIFPQPEEHQPFEMHLLVNAVGLVAFSYSAQLCFFRALSLKKPSHIVPLGYVSVVFAVIVDAVLFGYTFNFTVIAGIGLTSSGLLMKLLLEDD